MQGEEREQAGEKEREGKEWEWEVGQKREERAATLQGQRVEHLASYTGEIETVDVTWGRMRRK